MIPSYPAFGIELTDGALKAVKLVRRGTRLVVTWADYRPYARAEDGAVRPRAGLDPRALEALRTFLKEVGPGALDRVYVGLPAVATFNNLIRVPDVGEERLAEIARYEAHRSLRGLIEDYAVRTRVLRRRAEQDEIPCLLFAIRRALLDAFVADLVREGLEFDNLVPSPAALALFARYDRPTKDDRIVVSIGLRATEVVYMRDRGHTSRTLPLGVIGLSGIPPEKRVEAALRLARRLCAEIDKGVAFFFGKDGSFQPSGVALFGEGAGLSEVVDGFRRHFKTPVEGIGSLHRVAIDSRVSEEARRHLPQMGSAVGLAIAAARAGDPLIEMLEQHRARDAARRLPGLSLAGLLLSAATFWMAHRDVAEAERIQQLRVTPTAADVERRARVASSLGLRAERVARLETDLQGFVAGRAERAALLSRVVRLFGPAITDFGPTDFRLRECRIDRRPDGTYLAGQTEAPLVDIRAATVLRQRLASIPGLVDVSVSELEEERDTYMETTLFAFSAKLRAGGRG